MSWEQYSNYLIDGGICESGYVLDTAGNILACTLPIKEMPSYEMQIQDEDGKSKKIAIYEKNNLLDAWSKSGACSLKGGIRIYNQKYVTVSFDTDRKTWYLKKEKGGACLAWSGKTLIIATFSSELKMADGRVQNAAECNKRAEALQELMLKSGY